jgi:hypothetical protein
MIYTYDTFIDISIKMDKKVIKLDEASLTILNSIKKQLNIHVQEVLKVTIINKKENISQIFKILNKMTDKNYDKLKVELFDIIKHIETIEEINKITELIFKIASSNIFYSILFSKLYCELIQIKQEFFNVFQERFDIHVTTMHKLNYVDPNIDYDEYCLYIKRVEILKSSLTFFINLMKKNICSLDNIVEIGLNLQQSILDNTSTIEQNEEYSNSIYIIVKECIEYLLFHDKMNEFYNNIIKIQGMNISKKINFKCLDMLDIIKNNN